MNSNKISTINVLMPTKNRIENVEKVLRQYSKVTVRKEHVHIWIYVDEDDAVTRDFMQGTDWAQTTGMNISMIIGPKQKTMGGLNNNLQLKTSKADIYCFVGDDYLCVTYGWDEILRKEFNKYPDGLILAYPFDELMDCDQITHVVLSAKWLEILGRSATDYFPFWEDDTWLDEISKMADCKVRLDIVMSPIGGKGKTPRMKNPHFWHNFFINLKDERLDDAKKILRAIHKDDDSSYSEAVKKAEKLSELFVQQQNQVTDETMDCWMRELGDNSSHWHKDCSDHCGLADYYQIEVKAVERLILEYSHYYESGDTFHALKCLENIELSFLCFDDVHLMKARCYERLGCEKEALIEASAAGLKNNVHAQALITRIAQNKLIRKRIVSYAEAGRFRMAVARLDEIRCECKKNELRGLIDVLSKVKDRSIKIYVLDIDEKFRLDSAPFCYPAHNTDNGVEQDFWEFIKTSVQVVDDPDKADWHYLPVFWTRWHLNHDYGRTGVEELAEVCSRAVIDHTKTFTVCQYDDGPLVDLGEAKVFLSSRKAEQGGDIPLLSDEHKSFIKAKRNYLASFVGRLDTNSVRQQIYDKYKDDNRFFVKDQRDNVKYFESVMNRSYMALCPRGYGGSSFRFYEAMQMGVVPVLIGDIDTRPFKDMIAWDSCSYYAEDIAQLDEILQSITCRELFHKGIKARQIWKDCLSYGNWCKFILSVLSD